jgi:hypothetical protein
MHIEQVLADVPQDQRCHCREKASGASGKTTDGASATPGNQPSSLFRRLFGG